MHSFQLLWIVIQFFATHVTYEVSASRFDPSTVKPLGKPPDGLNNVMSLTKHYGYKAKKYEVVTKDGYILSMYRVGENSGPPVLFLNGWNIPPEAWVLHGSGHDLSLVLVDLGYDVWLGSNRAIFGSTGHIKWNSKTDKQYCDSYDLNELGSVDIPAMVNFLLTKSDYEKSFYVGSSLGGTTIAIACSEFPDFCASKLAGIILISPALQIPPERLLPPFQRNFINIFNAAVKAYRRANVSSSGLPISKEQIFKTCSTGGDELCYFLARIKGYNKRNIKKEWVAMEVSAISGSILCVRQFTHVFQMLFSGGGLRKFDFGRDKNMQLYGSPTPPEYSLSKMTPPTSVIYTEGDELVPKEVMLRSLTYLPNLQLPIRVDDKYGHTDIIVGYDQYKNFYTQLIDWMDKISGIA